MCSRDPLLIEADDCQRGRLPGFRRQVELDPGPIDVAPQLLAERVRAEPAKEVVGTPRRPSATAEFIGPPAESADHVLPAASCGPSGDRMRSMSVSPQTTNARHEANLVEGGTVI